jgi:hypothetical protein
MIKKQKKKDDGPLAEEALSIFLSRNAFNLIVIIIMVGGGVMRCHK